MVISVLEVTMYFNPRSHERSDFRDIFCFNVSQGFQSTLPREERHSCFIQCILHINFNPRSHERSDYYYHSNFRLKINFNPRSHERSDAGLQHNSHKFHPFQSTLPREERHYCRPLCRNFRDFNPRSHERSDKSHSGRLKGCADFNPRSHERSDIPELPTEDEQRNFNPRSHERSDPNVQHMAESFTNFNPRSHERSDEDRIKKILSNRISIHAPTRGATSSKQDN